MAFYFPMEVVTDILSRLPAKPLLRFKCVSKPWCSLIDSPNFIKLHLHRSLQSRTNQTLLIIHLLAYSVNLDDETPHLAAIEFDHPLQKSIDLSPKIWGSCDGPKIWGSCDGLVLVNYEPQPIVEAPLDDFFEEEDMSKFHVSDLGDTLVIWNPSTRTHHKLPTTKLEPLDYDVETGSNECYIDFTVYGIGHDSIHEDYKVVRIVQFLGRYEEKIPSEVKVYSLKSNNWRKIKTFPYHIRQEGCHGVWSNGSLHYVVSKDRFDSFSVVVAIDLATEEFKLVPMPNVKTRHMNVANLEGSLCVLCSNWGHSMDVWVMREYGVQESWTRLFSVPQPGGIDAFEFMRPLAYSKDGRKVLFSHNYDKLSWYDIESKVGENANVSGLPPKFLAEFVVQSLVPIGSRGNRTSGKKQPREDNREDNWEDKMKKTGKKRYVGRLV